MTRRRNPAAGLAQPRAARAKSEVIRFRAEPGLKAQIEAAAAKVEQTTSGWLTEAATLALARGSTR